MGAGDCIGIQDINYRRQFGGYECGGIKSQYANDFTIRGNIMRRVRDGGPDFKKCYPGIWLDWSNHGVLISSNMIYDIAAVRLSGQLSQPEDV